MLTIYMDESGFTGEDLLNQEQRIFVHVSTTLSDEECSGFYKEYFSGTQGTELKHKNLAKRTSGQNRIVSFIKAIRSTGKCTVWLCHKEFTLLTYLVDLWVEPAMHQNGIDLYRDGGNLALSNMAYYCLSTYQGDRFLREHLLRFQRMMIRRTSRSYREFWQEMYDDYNRTDERTRDILLFFLGGESQLGYKRLSQIPKRAIDPGMTTVMQTCGHWRNKSKGPFKLIYDKSSSLAKDKEIWDLVSSADIEERTIGLPERSTTFPLNVVQTEFADSTRHLQLQFCDLVAGATAAWCRQFVDQAHDEEYAKELGNAGIEELRIGAIWPVFEVDPEKLGMKGWSGEAVDFLTEQLGRLTRGSR